MMLVADSPPVIPGTRIRNSGPRTSASWQPSCAVTSTVYAVTFRVTVMVLLCVPPPSGSASSSDLRRGLIFVV
ncbi:hypothetical protein AV530_014692 [Patagioenas fasciata monilis]|uniref:Uncharacterized protein n=1 Tax=Patagioenas fasciata monilis TaxID=372326 RepID=A0A1V4JYG1_PATFA|nr:hypothetical protein AV530_014692 [Patagioenas fasciata monilis]